MELSSRPLQNPAVLSRKLLDDEMVLVNADSAISLALTNRTAVVIWEMADGKNSIQDIIDKVSSQFQDVPDGVSDDVLTLLDMLAQDGFVGFEWKGQS